MPPFRQDLFPVEVVWPESIDSTSCHVQAPSSFMPVHVKPSVGSASASMSSDSSPETQNATNITDSYSATQESGQCKRGILSQKEPSPPPNYTATYVDRSVQTSPLTWLAPGQLPNAAQHPHAYHHGYAYSAPWQYGSQMYSYSGPMPLLPLYRPYRFPVPESHLQGHGGTASQAGQRGHPEAASVKSTWTVSSTDVTAAPDPLSPHSSYSYIPLPAHRHRPHDTNLYPQGSSPLIAPLPQLPLPSPASILLASEPSSPVSPSDGLTNTSVFVPLTGQPMSLVFGQPLPTPPSRRTASPIENPLHPLYKSLRSLLLISESDPSFLTREITGEQLVTVHGVGIWSYRGNVPESLEVTKKTAFKTHASYDTWIRAARARTIHYATPGAVRPPLRWVLVEDTSTKNVRADERMASKMQKQKKGKVILPDDALQTGTEADGQRLFSARTWWEGGLHLGKAGTHLQGGGASISYASLEHSLSTFEILVGDQQYAKWVDVPKGAVLDFPPSGEVETFPSVVAPSNTACPTSGPIAPDARSHLRSIGNDTVNGPPALSASFTPIEGGREASGRPLLIAQAECERGWHPGKARLGEAFCCIAYGGGELWVKRFRVLGYII